jgi:hypothetical protein
LLEEEAVKRLIMSVAVIAPLAATEKPTIETTKG